MARKPLLNSTMTTEVEVGVYACEECALLDKRYRQHLDLALAGSAVTYAKKFSFSTQIAGECVCVGASYQLQMGPF